jgi:hypothetical protein
MIQQLNRPNSTQLVVILMARVVLARKRIQRTALAGETALSQPGQASPFLYSLFHSVPVESRYCISAARPVDH